MPQVQGSFALNVNLINAGVRLPLSSGVTDLINLYASYLSPSDFQVAVSIAVKDTSSPMSNLAGLLANVAGLNGGTQNMINQIFGSRSTSTMQVLGRMWWCVVCGWCCCLCGWVVYGRGLSSLQVRKPVTRCPLTRPPHPPCLSR